MSQTTTKQQQHYIKEDKEKCEFKVARKVFTEKEILEMEKEKIFDKCWLYLGHESEVANNNDFIMRKVGGRNLIYNRSSEGKIQAFLNACPHRGAMVCRDRRGNSKNFQCFYHAWTFNSKGELVGAPGRDGYADNMNCDHSFDLVKVPRIENYRGLIFVNFDENAISLEEYLAGAKEYLDLVLDQSEIGMEILGGTHEYSMRANWKLLVENSADGYHGIPTHKTYFEILKEQNGNGQMPKVGSNYNVAKDLGNGHFVTEKNSLPWGRPVARWVPAFGEKAKEDIEKIQKKLIDRFGEEYAKRIYENDYNMVIFPNLVVNNIMAVTLRTFYPVEPGYMEVNQWAIAPKEENTEFKERRINNFLEFLGPGGFATPDDNEALELCQEGYENNKEAQWNNVNKGMNKELAGETPHSTDEYHMRVFWKQWNEIMAKE
ncbi:p-cumate 2,3-dioxygenase alpha subunit [Neobacillus niacini]|uniref:aromatic ring-hydroxylating oxygenase subunit alpha n=1 Tax=Neobacillus niacini TaxID=86668 RepID=UPI0027899FEE|nr:aromatic ring-hydroxylating dioxygenase subunit alpha [Neobacillus niacini]MDQ1002179.1 p-cumate 2,3-dioxygenase alpha subunit [Neobacillus niacini]